MKVKRSEAEVKRAVQDLLKARGLMFYRMNAGDRFGSYKGKTWKIAGCPSGTADILVFYRPEKWLPSQALWCECKSSTGKQSPDQIQFQKIVEGEGHSYILVRSAAEVEAWLGENSK